MARGISSALMRLRRRTSAGSRARSAAIRSSARSSAKTASGLPAPRTGATGAFVVTTFRPSIEKVSIAYWPRRWAAVLYETVTAYALYAPASTRKRSRSARMRPSSSYASSRSCTWSRACRVPSSASCRSSVQRTGQRSVIARNGINASSPNSPVPKLPPMSGAITRIRSSGSPSISERFVRIRCGRGLVIQTVSSPRPRPTRPAPTASPSRSPPSGRT